MSVFNRYNRTNVRCADEVPSLSVFTLRKLGLLDKNVKTFDWRMGYPGGTFHDLHVEVAPNTLTIRRYDSCTQIKLLHVRQHFGNTRTVFECPRCRRQAYKLYEHQAHFACRRCLGFVHRSRRLTKRDRLLAKALRINQKLGWSDLSVTDYGAMPKHLRSVTVARLLNERDDLIRQAAEIDLVKIVRKFKLEELLLMMWAEKPHNSHVDAI